MCCPSLSAAGGQRYYLDQAKARVDHRESAASGVEDYYLAAPEAPGGWLGAEAERLGLAGRVVDDDMLHRALSWTSSTSGFGQPTAASATSSRRGTSPPRSALAQRVGRHGRHGTKRCTPSSATARGTASTIPGERSAAGPSGPISALGWPPTANSSGRAARWGVAVTPAASWWGRVSGGQRYCATVDAQNIFYEGRLAA
jgi:TrwC relaxase